MQNIKNFILYLIFIFSSIECFCVGDVKIEITKEAVKVLAPVVVESSKAVGSDAATAIANSNVEIAKKAADFEGIGIAVVGTIGAVAVTIYSIVQLKPIVKDTYEFMYPTGKQKIIDAADTVVAIERSKYLQARIQLRNCFLSSKVKDKRNDFGRPIACEEMAREFIMCGGRKEVIEMTSDFTEYWV